VAILAANGVNAEQIMAIKAALKEVGVQGEIVSKFKGTINN
jgi:catalase